MAEEGYYYESRFVCKLCNKRFPCGKSLGGHMRYHHVVVNSSAESEELLGHDEEFGNGQQLQSSYVLRENPKKTWRASVRGNSRIPLPQDKICKQCGKGFQSMKALCGHMACHSDRDRDRDSDNNKNFKDDSSWTTSTENHKTVFDSCSDTDQEEGEERRMRTRSKNKKFSEKSHFFTSSNVSDEIDGQDQEEVAMCLMLLSRDFGNNNNSIVESSDNNSVILETNKSSSIGKMESLSYIHNKDHEKKKIGNKKLKGKILDDENNVQVEDSDSDSGYFLDECGKAESYGAFGDQCKNGDYGFEFNKRLKVIKNELRKFSKDDDDDDVYDDIDDTDGRMASNFSGIESRKRKYDHNHSCANQESKKKSKYECYNCKKTFKSYQALGGHRPCYKRTNAFYESGENSLDESAADYNKKKSTSAKKIKPNNKNKGHVCPFCDRIFKNGQALGGHKRSHFIGNQSLVVKPKARRDLLDLNLPAPEADDGDNE